MLRIVVAAGLLGSFLAEPTSAFGQSREVSLSCGADQVVVGLEGYKGWWFDGLRAQCVSVRDDGAWMNIMETSANFAGSSGGIGSHNFTLTCPANFAVNRISGIRGDYVNTINITCTPLIAAGHVGGSSQDQIMDAEKPGSVAFGPVGGCVVGDAPFTGIVVSAVVWIDYILRADCGYPVPYSLKSFTAPSLLVVGGGTISVTLTMNKPANVIGGVPITITSGVPSVIASQTLTVGIGRTSQTFSVPTHAVSASTPVQLTARFGAQSIAATVMLIPPIQRPSGFK